MPRCSQWQWSAFSCKPASAENNLRANQGSCLEQGLEGNDAAITFYATSKNMSKNDSALGVSENVKTLAQRFGDGEGDGAANADIDSDGEEDLY